MGHLGAPPPPAGAPGPFALGDPERLRMLLAQAGLAAAEVEGIETQQCYESVAGWWDQILELSGPLAQG